MNNFSNTEQMQFGWIILSRDTNTVTSCHCKECIRHSKWFTILGYYLPFISVSFWQQHHCWLETSFLASGLFLKPTVLHPTDCCISVIYISWLEAGHKCGFLACTSFGRIQESLPLWGQNTGRQQETRMIHTCRNQGKQAARKCYTHKD